MRVAGLTLALTVGTIVGACSSLTGPGFELPEEDRSLDPAHVSVGPELFYCGDWNPQVARPTTTHVFADVFWGQGDDLVRLDHPLPAHRSIVEALGATVVRSYNLPGFRLWMSTDSVPKLSDRGGVIVRLASHPERYDVMVAVYYGPLAFGSADSVRIASLGGRVVDNYQFVGYVVLKVPNVSLPDVRRDPRVVWIEPWADYLCPAHT